VKNGKKLENGGTDDGPMGDSANVNPSLTEVTWTAEEKKVNGTTPNGTGNGTATAPATESTETEATAATNAEESEPLKKEEE